MPEFFFWGARSIDFDTARRGDQTRQNFSVCPRHWYIDADFTCEGCGSGFTWSAGEQKVWFEDYFFWVDAFPRHCRNCSADRRRLARLRREYDANVAEARDQGSAKQKARIVRVVSELEAACACLPKKMIETRELFRHQISAEEESDG